MFYSPTDFIQRCANLENKCIVELKHTEKADTDSVTYNYLRTMILDRFSKTSTMYNSLMRLIVHEGVFIFTSAEDAMYFTSLFNRFLTIKSKYEIKLFVPMNGIEEDDTIVVVI